VGASRLALAARARRRARRPARAHDPGRDRGTRLADAHGPLRGRGEAHGALRPRLRPAILVLTARQPRLPVGWNRSITYYVAIHSGVGQGAAVSAGCLHATEADVRWLMRTVPLGTPVLISS
jgi:hypothetical protein